MTCRGKVIDRIDQGTKDLVNGYIKSLQSSLDEDSIYRSNIPEIIKYNCIVFASMVPDKWHETLKGERMEIVDGDCIEITADAGDSKWNSAFLENIVSDGIHHWRFQVEVQKVLLGMVIGIQQHDDKSENEMYIVNHQWVGDTYSYAWVAGCGRLNKNGMASVSEGRYGQHNVTAGDIIDMYLDFNKLELSYSMNEQYLGKAFKIQKGKYRAAIEMFSKGEKIRLLSYDYKMK